VCAEPSPFGNRSSRCSDAYKAGRSPLEPFMFNWKQFCWLKMADRAKAGEERCRGIGRDGRQSGQPFSANPSGGMDFGHDRRPPSRPQLRLRSSPASLVLAEIPCRRMVPIKGERL
jgi:hypothetical protein